ncbi:glycoside hydrolase domain-containing protein [Jannaschia sp. R86511]|uniref:glycoside hydrolase domain-containing protein n=1 Tax=Jannaschia sp. R86511 TaxID=3093853 RepID=UPI0036D32AF2
MAQQWLNETYSDVVGYNLCPEDGRTGWATMRSLTRALQQELGLSALSDSFGPATMAALDARGPVGPAEPNGDIIRIVQSACYCKGYNAGGINGSWGNRFLGVSTDFAVNRLMGDLGLDDARDGTLPTKAFKALLTMDAYVLVAGGDPEIRTIQQWLNRTYWQKRFAFLIPCDGHYSRDVQKSLMKALQSAFGIPDGQVTGNFGPATQQGLRDHQLQQGATGRFVRLLSAACVFNGPVPAGGTIARTVFKETFDGRLGEYLSYFQQFSLLEDNGWADYPTWCQLLVSMGDPDREAGACDTRFTITREMAASLQADDYLVVGRYLDEEATSTLDKVIKPGELEDIFAGGMKVFPIWQYNARRLVDFTYTMGYDHGVRAHDRMLHYGFNGGAIVYFAVDYDATDPEITSNIVPYFRGVQAALSSRGRRYLAGVYGSRNVCARVSEETLVVSSFVSGMSWGFSGNLGFPLPFNWAFNQIKEFRYTGGGQTIDLDRVVHRVGIDPGIGSDGVGGSTPSSVGELLDYVDAVRAEAVAYGGADPELRTLEFLRSPRYTQQYKGWDLLLGPWDQDWIDHAAWRLGRRFPTFIDPSYGDTINVDHLAATANAGLLKGSGEGTAAARGDFGGWGGDLSTFYAEWRNNRRSYASGYTFCVDRLAKRGVVSSYGFTDMVEDVDGYLLGTACRAGAQFSTVLRAHLTGSGHTTRFRDFFGSRFGSSLTTATGAARTMLTDVGTDDGLDTLRDLAIIGTSSPFVLLPKDLAAEDLDPFVEGFAEALHNLAAIG